MYGSIIFHSDYSLTGAWSLSTTEWLGFYCYGRHPFMPDLVKKLRILRFIVLVWTSLHTFSKPNMTSCKNKSNHGCSFSEQVEKLKSCEVKEGWMMKDDEWWWRMKIYICWGVWLTVKQIDRQTDICESHFCHWKTRKKETNKF